MKCPKCGNPAIAIADDSIYAVKANKCYVCGTYHVIGSNYMSLKRQITGIDDSLPHRERRK